MNLGISSYSFGWAAGLPEDSPTPRLTALDLIDRARVLGVRVVQFGDNLPLHELTPAELGTLARSADQAGVRIETGTRGISPAHLRTYLELARRLRSDLVRVVVDTSEHHPGEDEIVETLRLVMPDFEQSGVRLGIENHDRFTAETLRRVMEGVGSPSIGICLDTANSLGAQEGISHVARTLAPWVVNLHVKDFAIQRPSHLMGFTTEGRAAGEGDLDIPWLLDFIRTSVPRPVNAILELWPPPEPTVEATLAKEAAWVESSVRYLRGLIPD